MLLSNINDLVPSVESKIQCFVKNIRIKKNIAFLVVKDVSNTLQVTILKDASESI
jgi:aspartyl/asparaginyl-tRNA synthetase